MTTERPPELAAALAATETIDSDAPSVIAFAEERVGDARDPAEAAARLFRAVRDGPLYDPYCCHVTKEALRASTTLARGRGWCVPKAILLAACCRAVAIPARLGFADVRNHLSTPALQELMGSDVYAWHGYTSIHLGGRWLKATPAFNTRLCGVFGMRPVDFDGRHDSLLHPLDVAGRQHLEYVADRGEFADTPVGPIRRTFEELYPRLVAESARRWRATTDARDFERDGADRAREERGD